LFIFSFPFLFFLFFSELHAGDFISTVDHILGIRTNGFIYGSHGNNTSSAGFYRNMRAAPHPNMYTHASSSSDNMTMVEPPFMTPVFQSPHKMPSINHITPPNYHIYQHPAMNNNSMPMQTPAFAQRSNIATPNQSFQNSNNFPKPVPCPAVPNGRPDALPVQTTSTRQPLPEQFKPVLHPPFLYCDVPQPHPREIDCNASSVHGQYLMQPSQMVRPNLAPATQQHTEWSHLAACNCSERPSNCTNQVTPKTMTDTYAQQQKECWFQQQQQQGDENQIADFPRNVPLLIPVQSHQDAGKSSVHLLHLPPLHDRETAPIRTVSTAAGDVQCQTGKQIIQF
jgi:hypothetical protein